MLKINSKSQESGHLTKCPFIVSLFLTFNQTSSKFFETPCMEKSTPMDGYKATTSMLPMIDASVDHDVSKSFVFVT